MTQACLESEAFGSNIFGSIPNYNGNVPYNSFHDSLLSYTIIFMIHFHHPFYVFVGLSDHHDVFDATGD